MLSPPHIRAMATPALLALLLGEEAATCLAGRSLIEVFALFYSSDYVKLEIRASRSRRAVGARRRSWLNIIEAST